MIALSATAVPQGEPVRIAFTACAPGETASALVDSKLFPATPKDNVLEIATTSLAPGNHVVAMRCGDAPSDPVSLTVVPPAPVQVPTVVCARNASPRDGFAAPLTSAAAEAETKRVAPLVAEATKNDQRFPTDSELGLQLDRCHPDWAWTFRMEDTLSLNVSGYAAWLAAGDNSRTSLHLFVDGVELTNLRLRSVRQDQLTTADRVDTVLTLKSDASTPEARAVSRDAWAQLLRTARSKAWKYGARDLEVSIGPAGGPQWPTTAKMRVNPYPTGLTIAGGLGAVALLILLVTLARRTPLLRDGDDNSAPYSLAKNQMAAWFVVVFGSFIFLTVTTGQAAALSSTALTLIGISGATGLLAVASDRRKETEQQALTTEKATLEKELNDPGGLNDQLKAAPPGGDDAARLSATITAKTQRLAAVTARLQQVPVAVVTTSRGWLVDILSDENGISFHRLQMLAWTAAMIGVFLVAVWRTFAMAEFDALTLGLLGISSGTYLAFKVPERQ